MKTDSVIKVLLIDDEKDRTDAIAAVLRTSDAKFKLETIHSVFDIGIHLKMFKPEIILSFFTHTRTAVADLIRKSAPGQRIPVLLLIEPDNVLEAESLLSESILDYFIFNPESLTSLAHAITRTMKLWNLEKGRPDRETALWEILSEKDVFLKELYHRIKNNFQTICSILSLQSQHVADESVLSLFTECQDRVRSMALIHERLQKSDDLITVDFEEYVTSLVKGLFWSYSADHRRITTEIKIEVNKLSMDISTICGLIINELVSNSLKYAFPSSGQQMGVIQIKLSTNQYQQHVLEVNDNGIGIPDDVDFSNPKSLGLQLVLIFARDQLRGQISLEKVNGTSIKIIFDRQK